MILGQGMRMVGAGIVVGLVSSVALARLMTSMLYQVAPGDPVTFAVVAGILSLTALVACWVPALRAALVDPLIALRHD
jgi:putative ABC transport system permease protein